MLIKVLVLAAALLAPLAHARPAPSAAELVRWQRHAQSVTITRDDWGIAHVHGRTDADAVFGMEYAQAEDDFARIELNYIKSMGRQAEVDGEAATFTDLRMRLFMDADSMRALYRASPPRLQKLMMAFADGLNYYLHRHPEVHPRLITRFEPWMALTFTEGSIGGDIERIGIPDLAAFYSDSAARHSLPRRGDGEDELAEPSGSNGFAIAPALTRNGHALLWINPHTSFYFRSELQMTSDEGLDTYGAVTWGQFFVYQGFNRTAGWMHTSSGVDNIDEFLETITERRGRLFHRVGPAELPVRERAITLRYRTGDSLASRSFRAFYTSHGPVVRRMGERWVSVSLMHRPVAALTQSYDRTKTVGLAEFRSIMRLHANSSNNTIFADAAGNIAYFHSNYIPRRDTIFDWLAPVDGADPATRYRGQHPVDESPNIVNPASGWVYNCNNWPWSAAGPGVLRREDFPRYVETAIEESPRGVHAMRVLEGRRDWTMQSLAAAAFDPSLPAFERLLPRLFAAYDATAATAPLRARFAEPIAVLRSWDGRWSETSVATTLAVHWGEAIVRRIAGSATTARMTAQGYAATTASHDELLHALAAATDTLTALYGTWKTPWGEINRFQRLDDSIEPRFDDAHPSLAVPFTSGVWGSLASFGARAYEGTRKRYGSSGNSFLAVVEFGDTLRARAVTAGGESGDPGSPHFADQAQRFVNGNLREVYFYPRQLVGHTERVYRPGE